MEYKISIFDFVVPYIRSTISNLVNVYSEFP